MSVYILSFMVVLREVVISVVGTSDSANDVVATNAATCHGKRISSNADIKSMMPVKVQHFIVIVFPLK